MYFNVSSAVVSAQAASASFTTAIAWQNFNLGSIQVIYSGVTGTGGTVQLFAYNEGGSAQPASLTTAVTMTTASSTILFNLRTGAGYDYVQLKYAANGNGAGTMSAWVSRKNNH